MNSPGLDRKLLRDVSRSFYLSLRLLPRGMRPPCSLGYLLARLSDTIADTPALPVSTRLGLLRDFRRSLRGDLPCHQLQEALGIALRPRTSHAGERRLIDATERCFRQLSALEPLLAHAVTEVVGTITTGQESDLRHFALRGTGSLRCLADAGELVTYTDQVAGCVGRFWTATGFAADPRFSRLPPPQLDGLGTRFGQALQLVNILRDLPEDLDAGRSYLPRAELEREGWRQCLPWRAQTGILRRVSAVWEARAETGLRDGLEYANSLRQARARMATALPALLGFRTLELLRREPERRFAGKVKISRAMVRQALWTALAAAFTGRPVRAP